jgi:glycosyltransferase involved in cell wall biosynthesis
MRALVYDQFWPTMGGGEKVAGAIAQVLDGAGHEVSLLAHEPVDLATLSERLSLDLEGLPVVVVDETPDAVSAASAATDLFVNASFTSGARNEAPHGLYYVHFPTVPALTRSRARRNLTTGLRKVLDLTDPSVEVRSGMHQPDVLRRHSVRWTTGEARLLVPAAPGQPVPVTVAFGRNLHPGAGPVPVEAQVDGQQVAATTVRPVTARHDLRRIVTLRFTVTGRADGQPVEVVLTSPTHRPEALGQDGDHRTLGVPVAAVEAGASWARRLAGRFPGLLEAPPSLGYLDTYDRLLSNSEFTKRWVEQLWDRSSEVLHPPVTEVVPGSKEAAILHVGRFFGRGSGHSKKQLELVGAFRRLHESGRAPGWVLHLVGGCASEHQGYVEEVRAAADGLPVELHVGASGEVLADLYARAAVYWHATGLGEDEAVHPDRFEHFGITTVEAMSAGAVPIVLGRAGQREIVRDGVDGLWFDDLDGLVAATARVVADPELRERLTRSARERSRAFGLTTFGDRLMEVVGQLGRP